MLMEMKRGWMTAATNLNWAFFIMAFRHDLPSPWHRDLEVTCMLSENRANQGWTSVGWINSAVNRRSRGALNFLAWVNLGPLHQDPDSHILAYEDPHQILRSFLPHQCMVTPPFPSQSKHHWATIAVWLPACLSESMYLDACLSIFFWLRACE